MTDARLKELIKADEEGRILISPLKPGDKYYAVVRDCNSECPYYSDFYGRDAICELDVTIHPFDGNFVKGCPVRPQIQERSFDMDSCSFVLRTLNNHDHIFLTREEAEAHIYRELQVVEV